jgi:ABC-2 type transport system ATP-binding protein
MVGFFMSTADDLLAILGLCKQFSGRPVLSGLSFGLASGEILGLVGANGGGKTTTLRMLAGLLQPDSGSGTFLGEPLGNASNRRHFGYMTQRNALYPELSVQENLAFRADVHGLSGEQVTAAATTYAIKEVMDKRVSALSGGWARRVEFVATVLHKPKLLLLDEPTAGLDIVTRRAMWRWMADLAATGCGIIVSTHDLAEAEHCSNILFYHGGKTLGPLAPAALLIESGHATLEKAVYAMATA